MAKIKACPEHGRIGVYQGVDNFCWKCGAPLVSVQESTCPSCTRALGAYDKFCGTCGLQVEEVKANEAQGLGGAH